MFNEKNKLQNAWFNNCSFSRCNPQDSICCKDLILKISRKQLLKRLKKLQKRTKLVSLLDKSKRYNLWNTCETQFVKHSTWYRILDVNLDGLFLANSSGCEFFKRDDVTEVIKGSEKVHVLYRSGSMEGLQNEQSVSFCSVSIFPCKISVNSERWQWRLSLRKNQDHQSGRRNLHYEHDDKHVKTAFYVDNCPYNHNNE